jgi:hypothetical protein
MKFTSIPSGTPFSIKSFKVNLNLGRSPVKASREFAKVFRTLFMVSFRSSVALAEESANAALFAGSESVRSPLTSVVNPLIFSLNDLNPASIALLLTYVPVLPSLLSLSRAF